MTQKSVLTIGAFDGLHLGHQQIIAQVVQRAKALQAKPTLVSFFPLPREFFARSSVLRLLTEAQKAEIIQQLGIEQFSALTFDTELSNMAPDEFVQQVLVPRFNPLEVWVGADFCYGHKRRGNWHSLQAAGQRLGFSVHAFDQVDLAGERISASRIRQAILQADFALAAKLLGRRYEYVGRVIHGQKLARELGFPTANLAWPNAPTELYGIYAVRVRSISNPRLQAHPAVASLGTRPTVNGVEPWLEVHLFDFNNDLYDQELGVNFVSKLRNEVKFATVEAMTAQIALDCAQAKAILASAASD